MTIHAALYTGRSEEWSTPQSFFDLLNQEFQFTLDPCATRANAKCRAYFTKRENGLGQDWGQDCVFCNPPYGRDVRQ